MPSPEKQVCVFFDRDGVVNVPPVEQDRYLRDWDAFSFIDGVQEVLALVRMRGYKSVLVTNQQGVAKEMMTLADLQAIHDAMQETLAAKNASFDAIYAATDLAGPHSRRKPSPAMLLEAAGDLNIDLARSWMVGDHDKDMQAGKAAGTGTIRFLGKKEVRETSDFTVANHQDLKRLLEDILEEK